jgi:hypothetical protein
MKTRLCPVLLLLATAVAGIAADEGGFKLTNRSSFTAPEPAHNPFWPIGWQKSKTTGAVAEIAVPVKAENFVVSTIMLGREPLAVINGREFGQGETLQIQVGPGYAKVLVAQIRDGEVVLKYLDREIIVPLHRK